METNSSETMNKVCSCVVCLCLKHTTVITHESFILFTHVHALLLSMYNVSVHDSAPFFGVQSENGEDQSESAQIGAKRSHDAEQPVKTEQTKSDPSQAPDPEEPDSFDDSQVLMESKFQPPEDASIITLHKCECMYCCMYCCMCM